MIGALVLLLCVAMSGVGVVCGWELRQQRQFMP